MAEISEAKANIIIALLAQLVVLATGSGDDPALVLAKAGMKQKDVANLLGLKPNAIGMRIKRASTRPQEKKNAKKD